MNLDRRRTMRRTGYRAYVGASAAVLAALAMAIPVAAQTEREFEWRGNDSRFVMPEFLSPARDVSWIGIAIRDADDQDVGATVTVVTDGSPAAQAGLREGDVVVEFDGERVRSSRHLARVVRETPVGRQVTLEVLRDGESETLTLATAEHPGFRGRAWMFTSPEGEFDIDELELHLGELSERLEELELRDIVGDALLRLESAPGRLGVRVRGVDGQLADYFGIERGLLVTHVEPSTPAAEFGLRAGDVITMIDETAVEGRQELRRYLRSVDPAEEFTLSIVRDGTPLSIHVTLPDAGP
ncbi:MAG: PDZ domain-containing protein [Acidobacteria bacterium]|nr:PDZ domain-containing protein [Acidobacteriota bacterium]